MTCCMCNQQIVEGMYSERYSRNPHDDRRVCGKCVRQLISDTLKLLARVHAENDKESSDV